MEVGSKVKLKTFNSDSEAPQDCFPAENYWLLIGKSGAIVKPENDRSRVLIQFDEQISDLGLHCHNKIPNSLLTKNGARYEVFQCHMAMVVCLNDQPT